jgi:hypothetical protein
MIGRLLQRIADRFESALIKRREPQLAEATGEAQDERPYLERYFLWKSRRSSGPGLFLHHFVGSDPGPELHDHPWDFSVSLVLTGGYWENRMYTRYHYTVKNEDGTKEKRWVPWSFQRWLGPLSLNVIRGTDFHQVIIPEGRDAWTLFFHGERVKVWGFAIDGGYREVFKRERNHRVKAKQEVSHDHDL